MMMKDKTAIFLKCGNLTLIRLLLTVEDAGPEGISTMQLFKELGTTGYDQITKTRSKGGLCQKNTRRRARPWAVPYSIQRDNTKRPRVTAKPALSSHLELNTFDHASLCPNNLINKKILLLRPKIIAHKR